MHRDVVRRTIRTVLDGGQMRGEGGDEEVGGVRGGSIEFYPDMQLVF